MKKCNILAWVAVWYTAFLSAATTLMIYAVLVSPEPVSEIVVTPAPKEISVSI